MGEHVDRNGNMQTVQKAEQLSESYINSLGYLAVFFDGKFNREFWSPGIGVGKRDDGNPFKGLFIAQTIARVLASKKVSPKGPGSGMRMLTYFINRSGRDLSATRRAELEKAKALLSKRIKRARSIR